MTTPEIRERIAAEYPELLFADGYDDAIIGLAEGWFDHSHHVVVAYDYQKCVELLMEDSEMDQDEAEEWMDFNVTDAYVGEFTPVFVHDWRKL